MATFAPGESVTRASVLDAGDCFEMNSREIVLTERAAVSRRIKPPPEWWRLAETWIVSPGPVLSSEVRRGALLCGAAAAECAVAA
ncbi:hypothetical protein GKA01_05850 [Gluconobacter kanchanaburiensis NBRC 103587]|uniref:Uncharacterized protein n=1 Tax=Gluconobacter kanchanaburiensis NBRC 103587 TaxID=1307948 RepID=A0A511B4N3_9PROT|nr:hypothetical protein AA103587_0238 [Gluconobacter kanchanaburiensis NBRC 103587]GEK95388.1 hypothetical protein GKA01_05850 [Gluconobacter kanchanaburiensis NBRC 103587]